MESLPPEISEGLTRSVRESIIELLNPLLDSTTIAIFAMSGTLAALVEINLMILDQIPDMDTRKKKFEATKQMIIQVFDKTWELNQPNMTKN